MTDEFLKNLRGLKPPGPSETARERARHRALIAFEHRASAQPEELEREQPVWLSLRSFRAAALLAFLVLGGALLFLADHPAPENLAQDRRLFRQIDLLFPHEINAIVEENGTVNLAIAQSPILGSDQPVLVVFTQGHDTIRVLSYSGHRLCLNLGKAQGCFDILTTPTGGVILESAKRAWLASEHPVVFGYSMRAQVLETL